ncbi:MAG: HNH endonuclease [Rhodobiaceae bacterium]|nr:HNH endonuclease [Rhodobiaceae bacterium]MCC0051823.1 HNH endonuclease [Rhodobiaceae bacterium]
MAETNIVPDSVPVKIDVDSPRFWSKVAVTASDDDCWEWQAATDKRGYGRFSVGTSRNATMLAHRAAFVLSAGFLPEAVCHRCDNPRCCNPDHLFAGTRNDNNKDMTAKGRHWSVVCPEKSVKGEAHGSAKLTEDDVIAIRREYASGHVSQRALAARYGVSQRTVVKIVKRIGWRHVEAHRETA